MEVIVKSIWKYGLNNTDKIDDIEEDILFEDNNTSDCIDDPDDISGFWANNDCRQFSGFED